MFPLLQAKWNLPPVMSTVIFVAYTVSLLITMLYCGSVSDVVGRRPVLLVGTGLQLVSLMILAWAPDLGAVIAARGGEGVATGLCLSAMGAGLVEDHRGQPGTGALINNTLTSIGTAVGAMSCALLLSTFDRRTAVPYVVASWLTLAFLGAIAFSTHDGARQRLHWRLIGPRLSASPAARRRMLASMPVAVAAASASGLTLTLSPALIREITGSAGPVRSAAAATSFMLASGITMVVVCRRRATRVLISSAGALIAGAGTIVAGAESRLMVVLLGGVLLEGFGFGAAIDGAIRYVLEVAAPTQRAGTLSAVLLIIYAATSIPTVVAGLIADEAGLITTVWICSGFVCVMAVCVLVAQSRTSRAARSVIVAEA